MEIPELRLQPDQYEKILYILSVVRDQCRAELASLVSRSGQEVALHGDVVAQDQQALCSLAASNLAATLGMSELIGEKGFQRLYHKGAQKSLLISPVGEFALVLLVLPNGDQIDRVIFDAVERAVMLLDDLLEGKEHCRNRREMKR